MKCTYDPARTRRNLARVRKIRNMRAQDAKERWKKWRCERQALMNVGFTPMTPEQIRKQRATRPVELTLSRKDADILKVLVYATYAMYKPDEFPAYEPARKKILNKLKRQGIK